MYVNLIRMLFVSAGLRAPCWTAGAGTAGATQELQMLALCRCQRDEPHGRHLGGSELKE